MAEKLKNNPFTQLFGSCEDAEKYSKLRHETNLNASESSDCAENVGIVSRTNDVFPPKNKCKVIKVADLLRNDDSLETHGNFSYVFETVEELDYAIRQFSFTHNVHDEPPTTSEVNNGGKTPDSATNASDCNVSFSTDLNDTLKLINSDIDEDVNKLETNKIIEEVFCFTLNKDRNIDRDSVLVYLEDFESHVVIDVELLEQVLFERLLLEDPSKNLIHSVHKETNFESTHATEKEVLTYLFDCYKRLQSAERTYLTKVSEISEMKNLVVRNSATALKQPDLFEGQILHYQVVKLFNDSDLYFDQLVKFFDSIVKECVKDENDPMDILNTAFCSTLDYVQREIVNSSLFTVNRSYMKLIQLFSCNNCLGPVMLQHSTPKRSTYGKSYSDTLLGAVLALSVLPKSHHEQYDAIGDPFQMSSATESLIWSSLQFITDTVHVIFYNLLKNSAEVKTKALQWIAGCLHSNAARGKIWSSHGFSMGSPYCVSDGFMLNLSSVLLHLCQPICANPKDLKICRIDPTYCAVNSKNSEEANSKGVHMKGLDSETCLIPVAEGTSTRPFALGYNFITECFFMAHRSLDLGFRVVLEQLLRLNQDIAQIQRAYNDAQNQAGAHSEVVEDIKDRLEMEMKKFVN